MSRYIFTQDATVKGIPSSQDNWYNPTLSKTFIKGDVVNGRIWKNGLRGGGGQSLQLSVLLVDDGTNTWSVPLPPDPSPIIPNPIITLKRTLITIGIIGVVFGILKLTKVI